jgi:hypothetical protein
VRFNAKRAEFLTGSQDKEDRMNGTGEDELFIPPVDPGFPIL